MMNYYKFVRKLPPAGIYNTTNPMQKTGSVEQSHPSPNFIFFQNAFENLLSSSVPQKSNATRRVNDLDKSLVFAAHVNEYLKKVARKCTDSAIEKSASNKDANRFVNH